MQVAKNSTAKEVDVSMQVAKNSTAKEVWDSAKVGYLGVDMVRKAHVQL